MATSILVVHLFYIQSHSLIIVFESIFWLIRTKKVTTRINMPLNDILMKERAKKRKTLMKKVSVHRQKTLFLLLE